MRMSRFREILHWLPLKSINRKNQIIQKYVGIRKTKEPSQNIQMLVNTREGANITEFNAI